MGPPHWGDSRVTDLYSLKVAVEDSNREWDLSWERASGVLVTTEVETGPWYVGVSDQGRLQTQVSSIHTMRLLDHRATRPT